MHRLRYCCTAENKTRKRPQRGDVDMHRLRYCCTPEIHKVTKYRACHQLGAKTKSSADPADPDYPDYQVSSTAARNLPTTRAGGQDDVSSQANSLKLYIWIYTAVF